MPLDAESADVIQIPKWDNLQIILLGLSANVGLTRSLPVHCKFVYSLNSMLKTKFTLSFHQKATLPGRGKTIEQILHQVPTPKLPTLILCARLSDRVETNQEAGGWQGLGKKGWTRTGILTFYT